MVDKVIHIITRLDKGGSAENVILTCRKTNQDKYDNLLIYGSTGIPALSLNTPVLEIPYLLRNISPINDLRALVKIYFILRREKPDIVHTHSSKAGIIGRWAAWLYNLTKSGKNKARIVHTAHGHVFYGYGFSCIKTRLFILLEQISAKISQKLIALTEGEKKESLSRGIGKIIQWEVVHSAVGIFKVDPKAKSRIREELNIPENATIVGTVARLEPVKGIQYFIEAVNELKNISFLDPVFYLIVGDGSLYDKLTALASELKLDDRIIFAGMRDNVYEFLSAMDIYVQPSVNEGMGKTIVQAQAMGLPVIASRVQGIPDALVEGKTGLLVPPGNSKMLAQDILRLIQDKKLAVEMGRNGARWVNERVDNHPRFSTERMIFLLEKLYDSL